ncbi:MAG: hypothetical protein WBM17_12330 [Anaerolineales bacterium]
MDKHYTSTVELGKILDAELSPQNKIVIYDHGDTNNKNVGEITAYYGKELHRDNKLAEIDIAVLDDQRRIIMLIEVEENGDRPKTVIGDAVSTLLVDGIAFRSKPCTMIDGGATLLLLAKDSKVGHKDRMGEINKRIDQMLGNPVINRLKLKRVKLELFREPDEMKGIILKELDRIYKISQD